MAGEEEEALACRECQTTGYLFLFFLIQQPKNRLEGGAISGDVT
jgi:hypothetical protein